MKKFIRRLLLFLLIPLSILAIEAFLLPVSFFTYRSWEALHFKYLQFSTGGAFYPNMTLSLSEEGDLAHHTDKAVVKEVVWITDSLGFRNETFIARPDVLLIGDSFFTGSGLSQDQTIGAELAEIIGNDAKVYNMSPATFADFDKLYKAGVFEKPKLIVFSIVERDVPPYFKPEPNSWYRNAFRKLISFCGANVYMDRFIRLYAFEWLRSRLKHKTGQGYESPVDTNMIFMHGPVILDQPAGKLEKTTRAILSYKDYCDKEGIDFLFVPMPNKESAYYDLVPFKSQPDYLFQLDSALKHKGVSTIATLQLYNACRKKSKEPLYLYDDSHWNATATTVVATEIAKKIIVFPN